MRPIDADAFDKCLEEAEDEAIHMQKYVFASALNTIRGNLRTFPTIEPERKKGKWFWTDGMYACGQCHEVLDEKTPFCPMCGADMRGE